MFFVLFVIVGSPLAGEELPLFIALFGKLCMYYSAVLQVSISRLVITAQLRKSVSCILSLSVGHLSVFIFPCIGSYLEDCGDVFYFFKFMQQFWFIPIFLLFLCYLERDFLFFVVRLRFSAHFSCCVCVSIAYV